MSLTSLTAQVGIGTTTPDPAAALEINAEYSPGTYGGLKLPTVNAAGRAAIATPVPDGLMIYYSEGTERCLQMYDATQGNWVNVFCMPVGPAAGYTFSEDFEAFTGAGFAPAPGAGQLESDIWIVDGLSDGSMTYGDTETSGDFARGTSTGGEGTGGVYAFDAASDGGSTLLGLQPGGSDITPGYIELKLQNTSSGTLTSYTVSYEVWVLNDEGRSSSLNLEWSPDGASYTTEPSVDYATPAAADLLGWTSVTRSITLSTSIAPGDALFVRFTTDDAGGAGARDEFGIDNLVVTGN